MSMYHVTITLTDGRKISGCMMGRNERAVVAECYQAGGLTIARGGVEAVRLY